jgi:hypothetical protein
MRESSVTMLSGRSGVESEKRLSQPNRVIIDEDATRMRYQGGRTSLAFQTMLLAHGFSTIVDE